MGAPISTPVKIELDVPLTRRTRAHLVIDATGQQIFAGRRMAEVFAHLVDNDIHKAMLVDDDDAFSVVFHRTAKPHTPSEEINDV